MTNTSLTVNSGNNQPITFKDPATSQEVLKIAKEAIAKMSPNQLKEFHEKPAGSDC